MDVFDLSNRFDITRKSKNSGFNLVLDADPVFNKELSNSLLKYNKGPFTPEQLMRFQGGTPWGRQLIALSCYWLKQGVNQRCRAALESPQIWRACPKMLA